MAGVKAFSARHCVARIHRKDLSGSLVVSLPPIECLACHLHNLHAT